MDEITSPVAEDAEDAAIEWREVPLGAGEQMVLNGALVIAHEACELRVSRAASVVRGKAFRAAAGRPMPAHELYYAALAAAGSGICLGESRYRLFALLAGVVAQQRTFAAQEDCSRFAAALISEDADALLAAVRRLATREARALGVASATKAA